MTTWIGLSVPRTDAHDKVTGTAQYPGDLSVPGMLFLSVVFADRPHARIVGIDAGAARAHPGVVAVLTAADVPHNTYGLITPDQPVLCGDVVRFVGDKVALVVAESREAAARGAELVHVAYADLPAVTDPREALAEGAPLVHASRGSNLLSRCPIRRGDAAAALAEADIVLEGEFSTGWQEHAYLQPEAGLAYLDDDGRVVVESAGQWLHEDRRQIAEILGLPEERVVVRYAAIGGAFGGREDLSVQHLLALAAYKLGRPVAIRWSREESMVAHHKRHPVRIRCRWGARRDGRIVAVESEAVADGGAYASTSQEVIKCVALFATGCYAVPNVSVDAYVVYTNNVPSGAFRGFGAPQAQLASETMVTRLALALGIDPVEMRRINLYREGDTEPTQGALPPGVSVRECLEACLTAWSAQAGQGGEGAGGQGDRGTGGQGDSDPQRSRPVSPSERSERVPVSASAASGPAPAPPLILAATLRLRRADPQALMATIAGIAAERKRKTPVGSSCGSVFKNPPGQSAGQLIERAGLKGRRIGGAEISERHANYIVNVEGASGADILALVELARAEVHRQFGVDLELEVRVLSNRF